MSGTVDFFIFLSSLLQNLCPGGSGDPAGPQAEEIRRDFGSFDVIKVILSASTEDVQGLAWV